MEKIASNGLNTFAHNAKRKGKNQSSYEDSQNQKIPDFKLEMKKIP